MNDDPIYGIKIVNAQTLPKGNTLVDILAPDLPLL